MMSNNTYIEKLNIFDLTPLLINEENRTAYKISCIDLLFQFIAALFGYGVFWRSYEIISEIYGMIRFLTTLTSLVVKTF